MIPLVAGLDRSGITFSAERVRPQPRVPAVFLAVPEVYGFEPGNTSRFLTDLVTLESERGRFRALLEVLLHPEIAEGTPIRLEAWAPPARQPTIIEFEVPVRA